MSVIYRPSGRAFEYSPLALNLYQSCPHACSFCYAPATLHKDKKDFFKPAKARKGILEKIENDCIKMKTDEKEKEILISFIGDPYSLKFETEADDVTRQALAILERYGMKVSVLTKGGMRARQDFDILKRNGWKFGSTIHCMEDTRQVWEPHTAPIEDRIMAVKEANNIGIYTWISVEPVIEPEEALYIMDRLIDVVDYWKVGKINHFPEIESKINWKGFLYRVKDKLKDKNYLIKKDLAEYETK